MRCHRILYAYSFRLTRRHSTICLIGLIVGALFFILQLYSQKYHEQTYRKSIIGDFDYQPGAFLKGIYPNESTSYCQFNYGLPETLNWSTLQAHPSPETGFKSPYRVIYNAIEGTAYRNSSRYKAVTYVTQATPEYIYHVVEIARHWDGPISLSVYVPNYDLAIAMQIMDHLCHCYSGMSKVSLHLFYPISHPPKLQRERIPVSTEPPTTSNINVAEILKKKLENYKNLNGSARAEYVQKSIQKKISHMMLRTLLVRTAAPYLTFRDCSGLDSFDILTYRRQFNMIYPINVGRNSARNASRTNYFLVSDIELVPSDGLATKFLKMLRRLMGAKKRDEGCILSKTIFVVPLFEVERGEAIPRDKNTLVELIAENRAFYFHQKLCVHCQRFPGLQTWLKKPPTEDIEPMMIVRREYPYHRWEPVYFGTNKEPWYSEILSWDGRQDKMTQMLELCLQEYRMVVLDGGFLCHAASNPSKTSHHRAIRINEKNYVKIIASLEKRYSERSSCKLTFGIR